MTHRAQPGDRRLKHRFAMEREVRYLVLDDDEIVAKGIGKTLNMSSGGVAFSTNHTLSAGAFIELSISWPVLLDDVCPMRLIAFGRVLRSAKQQAACTIEKYEFRTQSRAFTDGVLAARDASGLRRWADGVRKECMQPPALTTATPAFDNPEHA